MQLKIPNMRADKYSIQAELIYQTLGFAFAKDLFKDQGNETSRFKQMLNASSLKSTITDRDKVTVER